jgi:hypothetical protein
MKELTLVAALLLGCLPVLGSTDPFAQQLLINAKQQASFYHDQASSLALEVIFTADKCASARTSHAEVGRQGSMVAQDCNG